ncbi:MAG: hypothetical protein RI573_18815, partial [Balneolaceae bacterium]|nr:hypothetical protein [Balneolaceae bacterium]
IDADEKNVISEVKEDPTPYRGNSMKEAKEAMDSIESRVKKAIDKEKESTLSSIEEKISDLTEKDEYSNLSGSQKEQVLAPLHQLKQQAKSERYIGNLKNIQTNLGNVYTEQLNQMIELATPEKEDEPKRQFIKQSNIHTSFSKKELETEEDVDEYLSSLREAMVKHIQKNHNIVLD